MINVTKTYLPDREKYKLYVDRIYKSGWLTNNGSLVQELQSKLSQYLSVKNVILVSNGTIALQVAYKLLGLKGEVITTPFSFVATTSTIVWEGLTPVFVDIDPETLCIDPRNIEEKITPQTSGIVLTHVYGNACNVEEVEEIARKYGIKVVYDAAHAFGVQYKGKSLFSYGDVSTTSFHSTKIFHTIEGGALFLPNDLLFEKAKLMINFGINGPDSVVELGINAKMNEFQAAMGLCMLEEMDAIFDARKRVYDYYMEYLAGVSSLEFIRRSPDATMNYSYFPVLFESEELLLRVIGKLKEYEIYPRRYFYPSLDSLPYLNGNENRKVPVSHDCACRILCLPLYDSLEREVQNKIIDVIITESERKQ